jgi:2-octaprenylphenol hydroxylase
MNRFDLVVIGAGMVGASAALGFARKGLSVALLETQSLDAPLWREDQDIDLRVSAISPASQQLLSRLGVWPEIRGRRVSDYQQMHVWHENGDTEMHFASEQMGAPLLGSIVENALIQQVLLNHLRLLDNVTLFDGQALETLEQDADGVRLSTSRSTSLQARLVLAADGRGSLVRKLLKLSALEGGYDQTAIVANIDTELPHQQTAWQRFLTTGPVALLPLDNGQCSIVWSADTSRADELLALSDVEFRQALGEATEFRLGAITGIGERAGFPLNWHIASQWLQGLVLLIGDAAHGVHPLAGQGVNLGFGDVALLLERMTSAADLTKTRLLRHFERQRKAETSAAMHLFTGLKWVYGQSNPLLCFARDLGMSAVHNNNFIKRQVVRTALRNMG